MGMDYKKQKPLGGFPPAGVEAAPIQKRLDFAVTALVMLRAHDPVFPDEPELQERFQRVMDRLTNAPAAAASLRLRES